MTALSSSSLLCVVIPVVVVVVVVIIIVVVVCCFPQQFAQEQSATLQTIGAQKVELASRLAELHKDFKQQRAAADNGAVVNHALAKDAEALAEGKQRAERQVEQLKEKLGAAREELQELRKCVRTRSARCCRWWCGGGGVVVGVCPSTQTPQHAFSHFAQNNLPRSCWSSDL